MNSAYSTIINNGHIFATGENNIYKDIETYETHFREWHDKRCLCRIRKDEFPNFHYQKNYHLHCYNLMNTQYSIAKAYGFINNNSMDHLDELLTINNVSEKLPLEYGIGGITSTRSFTYQFEDITYYAFLNDKHLYWFHGNYDSWGSQLKQIKMSDLPKEVLVAYGVE